MEGKQSEATQVARALESRLAGLRKLAEAERNRDNHRALHFYAGIWAGYLDGLTQGGLINAAEAVEWENKLNVWEREHAAAVDKDGYQSTPQQQEADELRREYAPRQKRTHDIDRPTNGSEG